MHIHVDICRYGMWLRNMSHAQYQISPKVFLSQAVIALSRFPSLLIWPWLHVAPAWCNATRATWLAHNQDVRSDKQNRFDLRYKPCFLRYCDCIASSFWFFLLQFLHVLAVLYTLHSLMKPWPHKCSHPPRHRVGTKKGINFSLCFLEPNQPPVLNQQFPAMTGGTTGTVEVLLNSWASRTPSCLPRCSAMAPVGRVLRAAKQPTLHRKT